MERKFWKFHTKTADGVCQWAYCTEERARQYCASMHGHQNLTQWFYAEATEAEINRGLRGNERAFQLD